MSSWTLLCVSFAFGLLVCSGAHAGTPLGTVREMACAPTNSDAAAVLIGREIWVSSDTGRNWIRAARLPNLQSSVEVAQDDLDLDIVSTRMVAASINEDEEAVPDRRVEWGSSPDATTADIVHQAPAYLALSDGGVFAVAHSDTLFIGGPASGVRRRIRIPGIRGIVFDGHGSLWITVRDALMVLGGEAEGTAETGRWPIRGAGTPVFENGRGELLVPGLEGLWVVTRGADQSSIRVALERIPGVDAIAPIPGENAYYLVSLGRLKKVRLGHSPWDVAPVPSRVERIVADAGGRILIKTAVAGWLEKTVGVWHPVSVRAVSVDARGRIWTGTDHGPVPPGAGRVVTEFDSAIVPDVSSLTFGAVRQLLEDPGLPPCRRFPMNPLPRARIFFSWGRGTALHIDTEAGEWRAGAQTWLYLGFQLSWSLDPVGTASCLASRRRWQALHEQRVRKTESLWSAKQRAHLSRRGAADLMEVATWKLENQRLEELIRIISGEDPAKEER
ncbi:MAG: hypothetical protein GY854_24790 [Deltaproteobacteria bacterium]|nr:hypothetical protein [Deltaproteobacteria bacterium]